MAEEKPILFSYYRSSCSWRVRNALLLKNVDYEYKAVNLLKSDQLQDDYSKYNPMKQVPAIVIDGVTLTQSIAIMEYLEDKYPGNPLLPKDLILRAKVREICSVIGSGIQPLQNFAVLKKIGEERKLQWAHDAIRDGFVALEKILSKSSGKYCVGDEVTMADCCLAPQVYNANRFSVDMKHFPHITKIDTNLKPVFKKAHPDEQPDCPA